MTLLIELDEEYVKAIDKIKFLVGGRTDRKLQLEIIKAIKKGVPLEQEPFINKTCVSSGVCEHDKQKVLDKIRAEIDNALSDGMIHKKTVLGIIDKYKGESEG
jgi:hypothetical protein